MESKLQLGTCMVHMHTMSLLLRQGKCSLDTPLSQHSVAPVSSPQAVLPLLPVLLLLMLPANAHLEKLLDRIQCVQQPRERDMDSGAVGARVTTFLVSPVEKVWKNIVPRGSSISVQLRDECVRGACVYGREACKALVLALCI
jgi:hypothetical protein